MSQETITRTTCDGCGRSESVTTAVGFGVPDGWVTCYLGAKLGHACSPACGLKMLPQQARPLVDALLRLWKVAV